MNYYQFHLGDYAKKTKHLSWDEDMAYRRLLDIYYSTEKVLPTDKEKLYRLAQASTRTQKTAIDTVLNEFFIVTEDGFTNKKCDENIKQFNIKSDKARASADERWAKQNAYKEIEMQNAKAMRTHSEGNATHYPLPSNPVTHEPNISEHSSARAKSEALEKILREAAGWTNHPSPNLFVIGPIRALIEGGADIELDVLPTIRKRASRCQVPNWAYFTNAIAQAKADRIATSTLNPTGNANGRNSKPSIADHFASIDAAIADRERELGENQDIEGLRGKSLKLIS